MEYSIVIPAYNEADKITSSLTQVMNFMRSYASSFEIIAVDDGSSDKTADIIEQYSKDNPEVVLIRNAHKGKAAALLAGVKRAEGDYIYLADADFSTPISELKKLSVWAKDQDFDIVIASREATGAVRINEPFYRHIIGRIFNMIVQTLALPGINDTQCGFKLFKKHAAKDIFGRLKVYGEQAKEIKKPFFGALDVEVLYLGRKFGYKIKEVGVTWTHVKTTRLNLFSNAAKMVRDIILIRVSDLRGAYK
jgi:dolichyl-phosphate beta-glucosyltransferase